MSNNEKDKIIPSLSDTANTVEGKMLGKRLSTHRLEAIRRDPVGAAPMRGSLKDIVSELLDHIAATEASDVLENLMTCTEALTGAQIEIAALQSLVTRLEGERDALRKELDGLHGMRQVFKHLAEMGDLT